MTRYLLTTATALSTILGAAATQAAAEGWEYLSYGVEYLQTDSPFGELSEIAVSIGGDYDHGPLAFSGDLSVSYSDLDVFSNTSISADMLAGYRIEPQLMMLFGLEIDYSDIGSTSTEFSLGVEYERNALTLGAYAEGDEDDIDATVAYAAYRFSEATEVSLEITDSGSGPGSTSYTLALDHKRGPLDLSAVWIGASDVDAHVLGLGATYEVGPRVRVIGGLSYLDFGPVTTIKTYTAGAGYRVADNVWLDANYTRTDGIVGGDADTFGLELTFERGRRVMARDRMDDAREDSIALFSF